MNHKKSISLILVLILTFTIPTISYSYDLYSAVVWSDGYSVIGPGGQECICYALTNTSDYNISIGMTTEFLDENKSNIGTSSAYIYCLGGGQTTYIYAVNNFSESKSSSTLFSLNKAENDSAVNALEYGEIFEYDDSITFNVINRSSETVYHPQLTVVFKKDNVPVAITSGTFHADDESNSIAGNNGCGSVNVTIPAGVEYDTYSPFITAFYAG
ncbi:MAG: hypothetical protein LUH00_03025 [Lachnospiraceae bacterium]|nr:hypothetical protein [Lachnospiraceae bacterium]